MSQQQDIIFVVDDDPALRDALETILTVEGYEIRSFSDGASFLAQAHACTPRAVLLDVHMPGRSGIDILDLLPAETYPAPIFIISGQGDIPMAVAAIKKGAYDFIEKPFDADAILDSIDRAAEAFARKRDGGLHEVHFEHLTNRENEVLRELMQGAANKEIARTLGISPRTVEVHRARILEKFAARNVADLLRIIHESRPRA